MGNCEPRTHLDLGPLPVLPEAIGVDSDIGLAVKKLFFTLGANFAFEVWNCDGPGTHSYPERFSHPPDAAAATTRTASKG